MINRIQAYLQKPMTEQTPEEEIIGCLVILAVLAVIFGIGEIVYMIERRRK